MGSSAASGDSQPVHLVSPSDPYAACDITDDGTGTNYPSAGDEPYVTASPRDPRDAVGIFQQDRWSNGGARGLTVARIAAVARPSTKTAAMAITHHMPWRRPVITPAPAAM
ncbi:hypothetical protein [Streptomyces gibsoniae]|uniref:Uncharacterized protein n=1 Tax=Streptomyces gibsoniae TaxID=3075529 RepID=A0ABU2U6N6_9ACTN|nr:hypothetical protein [Streptomyces sp. DSM 41699]MDT0468642.1 hypothetical protein [Streptomyces sp. DSM 41699]